MPENLNGLKLSLIFFTPGYVLDRVCEFSPIRGLKGLTRSIIQTLQGTVEATGSVRELQVCMWSSIFKNYKWQDRFMTQISVYIIKGTSAIQVCNWGKSCTETSYSNIKSAELYSLHFWVVSDAEKRLLQKKKKRSSAKFMILVASFISEWHCCSQQSCVAYEGWFCTQNSSAWKSPLENPTFTNRFSFFFFF